MDKEARAASAAAFLYRYLLARAWYRSVDPAVQRLSEADLACHIGRKRREFDETVVNPETDPPITNDAKHHDFFDAIVNKRGTVPDMTARELAAYRSYVRNGDAPPLSKLPESNVVCNLRSLRGSSALPQTRKGGPIGPAPRRTFEGRSLKA
jgi:hypothetical protein